MFTQLTLKSGPMATNPKPAERSPSLAKPVVNLKNSVSGMLPKSGDSMALPRVNFGGEKGSKAGANPIADFLGGPVVCYSPVSSFDGSDGGPVVCMPPQNRWDGSNGGPVICSRH